MHPGHCAFRSITVDMHDVTKFFEARLSLHNLYINSRSNTDHREKQSAMVPEGVRLIILDRS